MPDSKFEQRAFVLDFLTKYSELLTPKQLLDVITSGIQMNSQIDCTCPSHELFYEGCTCDWKERAEAEKRYQAEQEYAKQKQEHDASTWERPKDWLKYDDLTDADFDDDDGFSADDTKSNSPPGPGSSNFNLMNGYRYYRVTQNGIQYSNDSVNWIDEKHVDGDSDND